MVRSRSEELDPVGPHPSMWRPPMPPDETAQHVAIAYLLELKRKVEDGAPAGELVAVLDAALARIRRL